MTGPKLTEQEVFKQLVFRDHDEYPVMSITELADRFDDVSRKTVQRRVESLAEAGEIQQRKYGHTRVYWADVHGTCPLCDRATVFESAIGGEASDSEHRLCCTYCGAETLMIKNAEGGNTETAEKIAQALGVYDWWARLGRRTRRVVKYVAKRVFGKKYPEAEYPETSLNPAEKPEAVSAAARRNAGDGVIDGRPASAPAPERERPD